MQTQTTRRTHPDPPIRPHLSALVSVDETSNSTLALRLGQAGLALGAAVRWGSEAACASMLERRPALILLDVPTTEADGLARLVRAASLIAPVAVLRHQGRDAVTAFTAGAVDVLDRQRPPAELACRIHANLRRHRPLPPPSPSTAGTASQRLLFDVITRAQAPICCHHLRLLLGTPCLPMTLRALKARIQRLLPVFTHHGLTLIVDHQWGLATYRTRSTKTPGSTGP
ncbi:hypothetical protein [Streptomyces sp. NPDC005407]|uniref:hypothetical protein n=1 Tax=Streptomyces sp. NPDC005407 TaxID=3155340 RepID=UPI0033B7406A